MIYRELQIGDVVERQRGWRYAETSLPGISTKPLDDEVDIEHQIAAPILPFGIANIKPDPVDEIVMPSPDEIVATGAIILGISYHQNCPHCMLSSMPSSSSSHI
ncbi:hypothetical protein SJ05684_b59050 (plasmid) [Sinorhizobium sojae CCBAU 05684]|uniref:Uncharacterized protein n=1 Tax=Sinorhizobium sojae CCBAU 05684 TaxID=716928 RepID=A0A249PMA6_9HYPH|nr:hypothetical protein SJ05684_b59050 [Sinorhizobium sojae CCBAU 05684]